MDKKEKTYFATLNISVDCTDGSHEEFRRGDELKGVLPGSMDSMIQQGQAVDKKPSIPAPTPDAPPKSGK